MTQYLIMIHEDEAARAAGESEAFEQTMEDHVKFQANNAAVLWGGNALEPSGTATSIGKGSAGAITDGPFAETKEALGGYYLVEAVDLDGALAIARDVPAPFGGVEVRPLRPTG